ncbi:MAG: hypothetical protein LUH11_03250 [Candidatus Gastranaerophilales bacterium]|nr:hypothetical protein [Candidatus Gastranaerophilales bacterium]
MGTQAGNEREESIGFSELLKTVRVLDSNGKQTKLGKCIDFELDELMTAINEYNKGGKITIELGIGVEEKNELSLQAIVKTTKPKGRIPQNPFFRDQRGKLYFDDPNQLKLINSKQVYEIRETHAKGANIND